MHTHTHAQDNVYYCYLDMLTLCELECILDFLTAQIDSGICDFQPRLFTDKAMVLQVLGRCLYAGLARTIYIYIYIYGVYTVYLAGKSPYIRSYTVCIYGSGQPYLYSVRWPPM